MRALWLLPSLLLISACNKREVIITAADELLFRHVGTTVFGNPSPVTMKEIHLDGATLRGKEVIIEGKVVEVSEHFTYMVITDDQARMLVVLTGIDSPGPLLGRQPPRSVRVLGSIESGQKGLPYVLARSINVVQNPGRS